MEKVRTIISKEWAEVFKNRMVLFSVVFMPLIFSALPLAILLTTNAVGPASADLESAMPGALASGCADGLSAGQCLQVYLVNQFLILFMMMPLIIPMNIAAYSVVGEKTGRTLEPLLATPITTLELLLGKNLAAVIPAVGATLGGFALFLAGAALLVSDASVIIAAVLSPMWLLAILVAGPLMAVLSVNIAMMVSSRVSDPRVAEQLSALVILPLLILFLGQVAGFLLLNSRLVVYMILALLALDIVVVYLSVHVFERENILTRWK